MTVLAQIWCSSIDLACKCHKQGGVGIVYLTDQGGIGNVYRTDHNLSDHNDCQGLPELKEINSLVHFAYSGILWQALAVVLSSGSLRDRVFISLG